MNQRGVTMLCAGAIVMCCVLSQSGATVSPAQSPINRHGLADLVGPASPVYMDILSNRGQSRVSLDTESAKLLARGFPGLVKAVEAMKENIPQVVISSLTSRGNRNAPTVSLASDGNTLGDCTGDFGVIMKAVESGEMWALQVLDSWGKPDTGLLRSFPDITGLSMPIFLGDFDECQRVDTGTTFRTQYFPVFIWVIRVGPVILPAPILMGVGLCAPETCSSQDIMNLTSSALQMLPNVSAGAYQANPQIRDLPLSDKAKAVIAVCSVFAALMLIGTIYDVMVVKGFWEKLVRPSDTESRKFSNNGSGVYDVIGERSTAETEPLLGRPSGDVNGDSYHPNWLEKFFLSFSMVTNGGKILSTHTGPGTITCINGIRFLSMTWVILGHTFIMGSQSIANMDIYVHEAYPRWTFEAIINALVSVDSFFTISGLLMAYLVMKELEKGRLNPGFFAKFYFHRYWRLTPPYMLVLMTYVPLFKYFADGPMWPQGGVDVDECEDTWWTNMLYINNFVKNDKMCMGWSWYLANDMQFYIISPLIFIPLHYFGARALAVPLLLLLGNAITSGVTSSENKLQPAIDVLSPQGDYMSVYYIKPYCRIGPYLVGMVTGYLLSKTKCNFKMSRIQVMLGWCVATAVALSVLYGPYEHFNGSPMSTDVAALFNALHRIAWGGALSWLVFACACGYGGFVNTLLSWRGLVPLSRLTYCAYLVHPVIIYVYCFSQRTRFYLTDHNVVYFFLGSLFLSYMVAFVASLAYEAPFLGLEKILLAGVAKCVRAVLGRSSPHNKEGVIMNGRQHVVGQHRG